MRKKEFMAVIGEFVETYRGGSDEINYHFLLKFINSIIEKTYAGLFVSEISEVVVNYFKRLYSNIPNFQGKSLDSLRKFMEYYYSIQPEETLEYKMRSKPHDYAYQMVNDFLRLLNENILPTKILSLDVESNGLWGKPISIGFTIEENGRVVYKAEACCLNDLDNASDWVKDNVIEPLLNRKDVTKLSSYKELLKWFADEYMKYKDTHTVVYHMGHIVEANLFKELINNKFIGEWDAPYTPIEVSVLLQLCGYAPDSVDYLVNKNLISKPNNSDVHQALYDAEVAGRAYWYLKEMLSKKQ